MLTKSVNHVRAVHFTVRNREDESFALLDPSSLQASCGVREYREERFTWSGQWSSFYPA